jgi:hypothetical protein
MKITPAEFLNEKISLKEFEKKVIDSIDSLSFETEDMIKLGKKYFEFYPDKESDRNMDEVHFGYDIVRCCLVEKSLVSVEAKKHDSYRSALHGSSPAMDLFKLLVDEHGKEIIFEDYNKINDILTHYKHFIDEIPKGMIKERFVGGISSLFNTLYLLKMVTK